MEVTLIYNILSLSQVPGTVQSTSLYLTRVLSSFTQQVGTVITRVYRWKHQGTEKLSNLARVTQLAILKSWDSN